MKFVMEYFSWAHGGSEPYDTNVPIEYSSKEKLLKDFKSALDNAAVMKMNSFEFLGSTFYFGDFFRRSMLGSAKEITLPAIYELYEWFDSKKLVEPFDSNIHECDMLCGFGIGCGRDPR